MKYVLSLLLFVSGLPSPAQELPDSVKNKIAELSCECLTLMKISESGIKKGTDQLRQCVNSTLDVFENSDIIKPEWRKDKDWNNRMAIDVVNWLNGNCASYRQFVKNYTEAVNKPQPVPLDHTNSSLFLPDELMKKKGMQLSQQDNNLRRWTAIKTEGATIQIVFDIRFEFNNPDAAAAYLAANMEELSENGELTQHELENYGADESRVYGANPKLISMFGDMDQQQFNFIFRVKNVVAKVFVAASKKASYDDALKFAKEAIIHIQAAVKKGSPGKMAD